MVYKVNSGIRTDSLSPPRHVQQASRRVQSPDIRSRIPLSKRLFDKVFATLALVFFAPFLVLVAGLILITSGRPILFTHERVGHRGRRFGCLKFRTMCRDANTRLEAILDQDPIAREAWEENHKLDDDPRISVVGAFLRKTSLDELPQLWNILKGDMSTVGPRPVVVAEARFYRRHFAEYKSVRPGLTGLWQVSGRSDTTYEERVAFDVSYIQNWSFSGDLRIILRTVRVILKKEGAR